MYVKVDASCKKHGGMLVADVLEVRKLIILNNVFILDCILLILMVDPVLLSHKTVNNSLYSLSLGVIFYCRNTYFLLPGIMFVDFMLILSLLTWLI